MVRKHRKSGSENARRSVISYVLFGDVQYCFLSTGRSKVIYPTEELAVEAAQRLNRLPSSRKPGAPYRCDVGSHWHLRTARKSDEI